MGNLVEYIYKLTDRISKPLEQIVRVNAQLETQTNKAQSAFGNLGKSALKFAAGYIGIQQTLRQGRAFLNLAVDMEQTRAKFETLTGSLERGNTLIEQLGNLSKKSPFSKEQFADSAETMLAFGIETEKVNDYLGMLGDIAMGDKNKLNGLTLAFSQMHSTGRLTGQDLLQMINQGFNPLNEISKTTGKSIAALKDEMAKGKITTQMVTDAFRSATSEGGQFYQMSEKIAQTAGGKFSTFLGTMRDKLTEYAERLQPFLTKVADYFVIFANNFDNAVAVMNKVAAPIRALITGLGVIFEFFNKNRGAIVALISVLTTVKLLMWQTTLASQGLTMSLVLQKKAVLMLSGALNLLKANPIIAITSAVALAIGTIVMLKKRTKEATDEYGKLNKKASEYASEERSRLDMIFDRLRKTNPKTKERNELVKQLKDMYPELLSNMNLEKAGLEELEKAYNRISESIVRKAKTQAYEEELAEKYKQMGRLDAYFDDGYANHNSEQRLSVAKGVVSQINAGTYAGSAHLGRLELKRADFEDYINNYNRAQNLIGKLSEFSTDGSSGKVSNLNLSGGGSNASVSDLTGGGSRATNVTINLRNLIENFNLKTENFKEGVDRGTDELIEGLLRVVNSANRIATQ
ncbi:MAG: tape measure protein [Lentimicrobiaceae bacterium]|nr:tape measure protein [Lentimicrobiaceae bacterium]